MAAPATRHNGVSYADSNRGSSDDRQLSGRPARLGSIRQTGAEAGGSVAVCYITLAVTGRPKRDTRIARQRLSALIAI